MALDVCLDYAARLMLLHAHALASQMSLQILVCRIILINTNAQQPVSQTIAPTNLSLIIKLTNFLCPVNVPSMVYHQGIARCQVK